MIGLLSSLALPAGRPSGSRRSCPPCVGAASDNAKRVPGVESLSIAAKPLLTVQRLAVGYVRGSGFHSRVGRALPCLAAPPINRPRNRLAVEADYPMRAQEQLAAPRKAWVWFGEENEIAFRQCARSSQRRNGCRDVTPAYDTGTVVVEGAVAGRRQFASPARTKVVLAWDVGEAGHWTRFAGAFRRSGSPSWREPYRFS